MTAPKDDIEFDRLLTAALAKRPEHRPAADLAQRAMNLAMQQPTSIFSYTQASISPEAIQKLARLRRRNRRVAIAASLLIGILIALGASRVVNGGYLNDTLGLSTADSSTAAATATGTTSTSTSLSLGVVLTGEALLVALFLLTFAGLAQRPNMGPAGELATW
jgi:predicted anti-sigma-YlaC factor YlaD